MRELQSKNLSEPKFWRWPLNFTASRYLKQPWQFPARPRLIGAPYSSASPTPPTLRYLEDAILGFQWRRKISVHFSLFVNLFLAMEVVIFNIQSQPAPLGIDEPPSRRWKAPPITTLEETRHRSDALHLAPGFQTRLGKQREDHVVILWPVCTKKSIECVTQYFPSFNVIQKRRNQATLSREVYLYGKKVFCSTWMLKPSSNMFFKLVKLSWLRTIWQ